ncbi:MAG: class B sortase [Clostridiales bacterium]|nr:class B sortase [Clostridiales bacterium]
MKHREKITLRRSNNRRNNKRYKKNIKLLLIIPLCLFIGGSFLLVRYAINTASAKKLQQETKEIYSAAAIKTASALPPVQDTKAPENNIQISASLLPKEPLDTEPSPVLSPGPAMGAQFISLYKKNSDLAGWLKSDAVPQIDFPVVQKDNIHYLDRDFYGKPNQSGTVFADESVSLLPASMNVILHGHNMKNGTMFGKLYEYLSPDLMASNPLLEFSTLYESSIYVPYAVSIVSLDPQSPQYVSLAHEDFSSATEMLLYADELQKFSKMQLPIDVIEDDKLLTLITCHGNEEHERLVLALRRLRLDENVDVIKGLYLKNKL